MKTPKKSLRVGPIDEKKNTSFLQVFFLISKSAEKTLFSFLLMEYHFQRDEYRIHIRIYRSSSYIIPHGLQTHAYKLTLVVLHLIGVTTKVKCGKTLTQLIRQKPTEISSSMMLGSQMPNDFSCCGPCPSLSLASGFRRSRE